MLPERTNSPPGGNLSLYFLDYDTLSPSLPLFHEAVFVALLVLTIFYCGLLFGGTLYKCCLW